MAEKKGGASATTQKEDKRDQYIKARIYRVFDDPNNKLKAVASANIGDYAVHGIRLYQNDDGEFFVSMPANSYRTASGETKYEDIFHPVTKESREALNSAVHNAYEQELAQRQASTQGENEPAPAQVQKM